MLRAEFDAGMNRLMTIFEKKVREELADIIFDKCQHFVSVDWKVAIRSLCDDSERRMMPRMGEILHACDQAATDRREREWNITKAKERKEIDELMQSTQGDTIRSQNKIKLRRLIEAIGHGKAAVDVLAQEFADEADSQHTCACENGLVFYMKPGPDNKPYQHVGACGICDEGKQQPKSYPRIDPETLQLM